MFRRFKKKCERAGIVAEVRIEILCKTDKRNMG